MIKPLTLRLVCYGLGGAPLGRSGAAFCVQFSAAFPLAICADKVNMCSPLSALYKSALPASSEAGCVL